MNGRAGQCIFKKLQYELLISNGKLVGVGVEKKSGAHSPLAFKVSLKFFNVLSKHFVKVNG